jgi:hypothetical protein
MEVFTMTAMGSRARIRTIKGRGNDTPGGSKVLSGKYFAKINSQWVKSNLLDNTQKIDYYPAYAVAEGCYDELHSGPPWTGGGPFTKIKISFPYNQEIQGYGTYDSVDEPVWYHPQYAMSAPIRYVGGYGSPAFPSDQYEGDYWNLSKLLGPTSSLIPDLGSWGPEAWAKTAPKIEMASGLVFLSESRDIPRMLQQSSEHFHDAWKQLGGNSFSAQQAPKKASDAFLNQQFGWSPFLSDLGKFSTAFGDTAKYMSQMSHGNDKWKTYRRTLLDDYQVVKVASGTGWRVQPAGVVHENILCTGPATWELYEEISTLVTTSGQFKWYKPEFDLSNAEYNSAMNRIGRQMTMYGLRINPSNVWRATPWTWLIDWGLNVGRNIDRVTEYLFDGVVSKYLYVMQHRVRTMKFITKLPFRDGPRTLTFSRIIDVKQRTPSSSPFGFSLPWSGLDARKLAILSALGISRQNWGRSPGI